MPGRLEGKVCVITGAAGGIGAETRAGCSREEGAKVVGVDLAEGAAGDLALQADVADEDAGRATCTPGRVEEFGPHRRAVQQRRDLTRPTTSPCSTPRSRPGSGSRTSTCKSVFLCCKHGIPHLLESGGGSVINTASFVAVMGAATSQISYTASKGGVLALSRELGVEFAQPRRARQRALPRARQHAAAAGAVRQGPRAGGAPPGPPPDGPLRRAARDRPRRAVPRQRRVVVRDRLDVPGRRRARGAYVTPE